MSHHIKNLDDWLEPLHISSVRLCSLVRQLATTYSDLALHSTDQFLATPITSLPTGRETGEYLTIDLGGTNLRIAFVTLLGSSQDVQVGCPEGPDNEFAHDRKTHLPMGNVRKSYGRSWPIHEHLKVEKAEDLFAWVGDCLAEVVEARFFHATPEQIPNEIPLGITFSFPMMQSTITEATLMPMGKGFTITSNPDLGGMVLKGYERYTKPHVNDRKRGLGGSDNHVWSRLSEGLPNIRIAAISNDAVATLLSLAYSTRATLERKTAIGLILGTGCNAAVCLKPEALGSSKRPSDVAVSDHAVLMVNTEWTLRGTTPALCALDLITRWDKTLDEESQTPGFQPFEYMTAGSYLGEVVRLVLVDTYTDFLQIQRSCLPSALLQRQAVTTPFLAQIVATTDIPHMLAGRLRDTPGFEESELWTWTVDLCAVFLKIESLVLRRSAAMIAAAILALLITSGDIVVDGFPGPNTTTRSHLNLPEPVGELVVAYCGGLICLYPDYKEQIQMFLDTILHDLTPSPRPRVVLREASEGGVIGAGVLSALQCPSGKDDEQRSRWP
ncbi:hypothetical protein MMC11_008495 [Xylographa trunciseda]|nr:hypothetical protein [Xylographa trunciseda]